MPRAYLGLGTNIGDRRANLQEAVRLLSRASGVTLDGQSFIYETTPVGVQEQPDFLNMVVAVQTQLAPRELLNLARSIERQMGRQAGPRWGPRVIDVDVLLCGDAEVQEQDLTVPHPRMWARAFVLVPLADVAPDLVGPGGEMVRDLAEHAQGEVRRWEGGG